MDVLFVLEIFENLFVENYLHVYNAFSTEGRFPFTCVQFVLMCFVARKPEVLSRAEARGA